MAITQADIQPFISQDQVGGQSFMPPSYASTNPNSTIGTSGGPQNPGGDYNMFSPTTIAGPFGPGTGPNFSGTSTQTAASILAPGLGNLLNGLLGGNKNYFQPYYNDKGQLVYGANQNAVPPANVPGAPQVPSKEYRKTAQSVQAITDLLPYYQSAVNQQVAPTAAAQLGAAQATSGPYAQLMTQLYNQYGPQLNAIGNEIARRNALSEAQTQGEVLAGPGKDLVNQAYQLSQVYDKPYYDTRATTAGRISDLLNSVDLSGNLSKSEQNQIDQGLARQNLQAGTQFAPNQSTTVANAMQYGQAAYQRKQQAQNQLAQAIQASSAFLPASKSGVDVFQVATGRPSVPNSGNSLFTGVNNPSGSQGAQLGGQMFSGMNSLQQTQMNIDAQKKDWLDQMNQFTSSLSNIGSMAGGAMALCWVAREVYGVNDPRWLMFRHWVVTKSPNWFRHGYVKYGPRIAKFISNKPWLKKLIKLWMNTKLCPLNA